MPDYLVLLEGTWLVKDVKSIDDATNITISEIGKRLNPKLKFVDFQVIKSNCPICGGGLDKILLVAGTALLGIEFKMKVFNAKDEKHATQIAKSVIGRTLKDTSLEVIDIEGPNIV